MGQVWKKRFGTSFVTIFKYFVISLKKNVKFSSLRLNARNIKYPTKSLYLSDTICLQLNANQHVQTRFPPFSPSFTLISILNAFCVITLIQLVLFKLSAQLVDLLISKLRTHGAGSPGSGCSSTTTYKIF